MAFEFSNESAFSLFFHDLTHVSDVLSIERVAIERQHRGVVDRLKAVPVRRNAWIDCSLAAEVRAAQITKKREELTLLFRKEYMRSFVNKDCNSLET